MLHFAMNISLSERLYWYSIISRLYFNIFLASPHPLHIFLCASEGFDSLAEANPGHTCFRIAIDLGELKRGHEQWICTKRLLFRIWNFPISVFSGW